MERLVIWAAVASLASVGSAVAASKPDFAHLPDLAETDAAYPAAALEGNFGGRVDLRCKANARGGVEDCAIVSERPGGLGFGVAALTLTQVVRLKAGSGASSVDVPVEFLPKRPVEPIFKPDRERRGLGGVGPYYPIVAVDAGITGVAMMACERGAKGELNRCRVLAEAPQNVWFGGAALRMAETRWITVKPRDNGDAQVGEPIAVVVPFTMDKRRR